MTSINEIPWAEKYRPESLDEVIGNEYSVNRMKDWVDDNSAPHLLLQGPAGTGKTASIVAFAKEKYGDDWNSNLIQLNASDERGIDIVRDQIKSHAQESPSGDYEYKIIHLDEADSMTKDAMNALRRPMEKYSDQTRFFLSCNYSSQIIDPILSRCIDLSFNRLDNGEIREILVNIAEEEEVEYEIGAIDQIVDYVRGDARRAVNSLQNSVRDGSITEDTVDFVNLQAEREDIEEMLSLAVDGKIEEAIDLNMSDIQPKVTDYGRFCRDVMNVVQRDMDSIPDDVRWYIISQIGELEKSILEGASPDVQTNSFVAMVPVVVNSSISNYE